MTFVGVKHHKNDDKLFWFYVPKSIADHVAKYSDVVCSTSKGNSRGVVEEIIITDNVFDAKKLIQRPFPLNNIVAVKTQFPLWMLSIPARFVQSKPSPEKIASRVRELYRDGRFNTMVEVNSDGVLTNGYTAFLVATMFYHDTIECLLETMEEGNLKIKHGEWGWRK